MCARSLSQINGLSMTSCHTVYSILHLWMPYLQLFHPQIQIPSFGGQVKVRTHLKSSDCEC